MISCSVSISDDRTRSAVRAVLSLSGIAADNGQILITDSPYADISNYAGAVILSHSRIVPEEKSRVRVLRLPFAYSELTDVLHELSDTADTIPRAAENVHAEEKVRPEISDGVIGWRGRSVQLTEREFRLFEYLCAARGRIVPRSELMEAVWDGAGEGTNVADVYISYLRKKLIPLFGQGVLVTVRGQGYMLNLPE